jgi:hypothetical protein
MRRYILIAIIFVCLAVINFMFRRPQVWIGRSVRFEAGWKRIAVAMLIASAMPVPIAPFFPVGRFHSNLPGAC